MNENDPYRYVGQGGGTYMSTGDGKSTQDRIIDSVKMIGTRLIALENKVSELENKLNSL